MFPPPRVSKIRGSHCFSTAFEGGPNKKALAEADYILIMEHVSVGNSGVIDKMTKLYEWNLGQSLPVLGEHSVAKHEIYEQYIRIYIDRLTRTPSQTMLNLTIVDGFSGGGLYRLGSAEVDG